MQAHLGGGDAYEGYGGAFEGYGGGDAYGDYSHRHQNNATAWAPQARSLDQFGGGEWLGGQYLQQRTTMRAGDGDPRGQSVGGYAQQHADMGFDGGNP